MGFLKITNNDSFLSSGKEIQSLISLITRKQFSPQREGARVTFPFERLNLYIMSTKSLFHFFLGMIDTLVKGLQKFSAQEWEKIHASRTDEIPQDELIAYSKVKRRLYVKYMRQSNARS